MKIKLYVQPKSYTEGARRTRRYADCRSRAREFPRETISPCTLRRTKMHPSRFVKFNFHARTFRGDAILQNFTKEEIILATVSATGRFDIRCV